MPPSDRSTRRSTWPLLAAGLLASLLAACGPEEPVATNGASNQPGANQPASNAVADAQGNLVAEATASEPAEWSSTGAYLAGMTAFDARDMGKAADLLSIALGEELNDPALAQKTLFALLSDNRIPDAVELAKRMQTGGLQIRPDHRRADPGTGARRAICQGSGAGAAIARRPADGGHRADAARLAGPGRHRPEGGGARRAEAAGRDRGRRRCCTRCRPA